MIFASNLNNKKKTFQQNVDNIYYFNNNVDQNYNKKIKTTKTKHILLNKNHLCTCELLKCYTLILNNY